MDSEVQPRPFAYRTSQLLQDRILARPDVANVTIRETRGVEGLLGVEVELRRNPVPDDHAAFQAIADSVREGGSVVEITFTPPAASPRSA